MTTSAAVANAILIGLMVLAAYLICCGAVFNMRLIARAAARPRHRRRRAAVPQAVAYNWGPQTPAAPPAPAAAAPPLPKFDPTVSNPGWYSGRNGDTVFGDYLRGDRARPFSDDPGPRDW